jgi:hypothetical protein
MEHDAIIADHQLSRMRLEEQLEVSQQRVSELEAQISELRMRVIEEGANPMWHRRMLAKHSTEWPMLWSTIFKIINS